jgi:PAS domain S-box-containing protein
MNAGKTLRSRLVTLVVVAILPLFGLAMIRAVLETDTAISTAEKNLQFAASSVAANQADIATSARQMLIAVGNHPDLAVATGPVCEQYFKALVDQLKVYANIGIIDADGYSRCNSSPGKKPSFAGDRSYVKDAVTHRVFVASNYLAGRLSGRPIVNFVLPLPGRLGDAGAVAFGSMYVAEISTAVSQAQLPPGSQLLVLDREGIVLAANPETSAVVGRPTSSPTLLAAINDGRQGILHGSDAVGIAQIYALSLSSKSPYSSVYVAVSSPRHTVLAPARNQLLAVFLSLSVVALISGWFAWRMGGNAMVRPAADILDAAAQLEAGRLNVRVQERSGTSDEFTRIALAVNRMAESLEQRESELATQLANSRSAEAELSSTQQKLLDAQRMGRIGHWEFNMESGLIVLSDQLLELLGLPPGGFDGNVQTLLDLLHPDDRERFMALRRTAHANGERMDIEYRIITPSGDVRWMHQAGTAQAGEERMPFYRSGVIQEITQRKEAELALARVTSQLQRTSQMARVGGWDVDLVSMTGDWSDELLHIHELDVGGSMDPMHAMSFYAPEARPVFRAAVRAAIEQARPWDLELPLITAKGRQIWVRTQGRAVTEGGKVVGLTGAMQDITAQHEASEHLRLLESSISRLNDMVLITDAEPIDEPGPRILYVNRAFERHTGYTREEVLGKSPRFLQGPGTQQAELRRIREALQLRQPVRVELINYKKSGEEFWVEIDIVPITDSRGWFTHLVAVERDITERKRAEQALVESEQRYAVLFDAAPVPMFVYDPSDFSFLKVNTAAMRNYGYSEQEFLSIKLFKIRLSADQERLGKHLRGSTKQDEFWLHQRKDGTAFPVRVVSKSIQYAGKDARFVVAFDVTAQVKAENDMHEHLFTLQRAADAAQAITWHQTVDGMLNEVGEQARGVIGAHQSIISLIPHGNRTQAINTLSLSEKYDHPQGQSGLSDNSGIRAMVCETNRAVRMTQAELETHPRWTAADRQRQLPMRGWLAVPLTGRNGENIGLLQLSDKYEGEFTLEDEYVAIELAQLASIAIENVQLLQEVNQLNAGLEQKVVERTVALARQEALFRALSEQAPQVVWTADLSGGGTYYNRAWFELVGGKMEDWTGTQWFSVVHPEDLPEVRKNWQKANTVGSPFVGVRRMLSVDGSYHTMSYRGAPVRNELGEVTFWVGIDADITDLKNIETALLLSNQELEAFSYSVSHDLRSPLNTVDGFSRLLAKQLSGDIDVKARHYLARIQAGVAQMGKLIEDLLSLAQVSRLALRSEPVDISALSNQILQDWRDRQPERQVECHVQPGLMAQADGRLIRVALENLLGNAWKFTSQKPLGVITVGKRPDASGQAVFYVSDNGAGFDMAYSDKLFIAFQRLHTADEFPGTGVGLATVSRVMGRYGGKLWAEAAIDKGASFFFALPVPTPVA